MSTTSLSPSPVPSADKEGALEAHSVPIPAVLNLCVEDTGTGMAKEVIEHIFDRFYKGDAFKQGTGLGLAICRTIAERFKGKIEVASTPGKGTRFTIILPLKVEE